MSVIVPERDVTCVSSLLCWSQAALRGSVQRGSEKKRPARQKPTLENSPEHSVSKKKAPETRLGGSRVPVLGAESPARLSPLHPPSLEPSSMHPLPGGGVCLLKTFSGGPLF